MGHAAGGAVGWGTALQASGSIPDGVIGVFHSPTMALGLTQPLAEYKEYFLGGMRVVKAGGASGWQPYHLHLPIFLKSVSLNFLEPSGPVQASNGIVSP
jgi:hypothetical protein